ncbi:AraC family transcriptional regulator [Granulicella sp. dw_53]|uniref:AraC family transcriptional regulator n=1 Tax=Granulicella sp. dw_53 TaxID=2719792 RepID=UPI001BD4771A|nr:AraC family transcriptional regulator [Granulicella sp. dw_53]
MDPISDVLSLLNPRASISASLTTGGDWAVSFPAHEGLKFVAVVRGLCWLAVDGVTEPIEVRAGDCYLLTTERAHRQGSDLSLEADDVRAVFAEAVDGRAQYGESQETMLIGGRFSFDREQVSILVDSLPPVILIRAGSSHASTISWILERLGEELSVGEPGASLMVDHLAHMLLVQVLRAHLASGERLLTGWLGALADAKVGLALKLMHGSVGRRWTLADLTRATGMSRSAFSSRFKRLVGTGPLDYLLRWRMQVAAKRLRGGAESITEIAASLGYESESAFGSAFKRVMGRAPKRYQRAQGE